MANEQQQAQQPIHPAAAACEFMQRADLKGNEVEVFAQTFNWLQSTLNGELIVIPQEMFEEQQARLAQLDEYIDIYGELEEDEDEVPDPT